MRIRDESPSRLTFVEPMIGHKVFFGIAAVAFAAGAVGIATSGDVPLAVAAIPAAISLGGIAGLWYGGKPNVTILDRDRNQLRKVVYHGSFSGPEVTECRLSDFTGAEIKVNHTGSYRTYGIFLTRGDDEPVQIGMYERGERKMVSRMDRIVSFLGIPRQSR